MKKPIQIEMTRAEFAKAEELMASLSLMRERDKPARKPTIDEWATILGATDSRLDIIISAAHHEQPLEAIERDEFTEPAPGTPPIEAFVNAVSERYQKQLESAFLGKVQETLGKFDSPTFGEAFTLGTLIEKLIALRDIHGPDLRVDALGSSESHTVERGPARYVEVVDDHDDRPALLILPGHDATSV